MVDVTSLLVSVEFALLLVGVACLYAGAELLVSGAASLALGWGVRATTVGVTIIAFATTAPELIVSTLGGVTESDQIALGNVVGSNVANIGLVLGLSAVAYPMEVDRSLVRKHGPVMLIAVLALAGLSLDRRLAAVDGVALLVLLGGYTGYLLYQSREADGSGVHDELDPDATSSSGWLDAAKIGGAAVFLFAGSRGLIVGGQGLLQQLGFGDLFIGLTVIAFGTSLPELAASLVSSYREGAAFSVGNVIGSNIYNVLAVVGVVAVIVPIHVSATTMAVELPLLVAFTVCSLLVLDRRRTISRPEGLAFVLSYALFLYVLLGSYGA